MSYMATFRNLSFAALVLAASRATPAAADSQDRFGTREPYVCDDFTDPPDAEDAASLVQCNQEVIETRSIRLLTNVVVHVGSPQPYNSRTHSSLNDADAVTPVYPIRGSFRRYNCDVVQVNAALNWDNHGKNCSYVDKTAASGFCWKTTFGTWSCYMDDNAHNDNVMEQPPPEE